MPDVDDVFPAKFPAFTKKRQFINFTKNPTFGSREVSFWFISHLHFMNFFSFFISRVHVLTCPHCLTLSDLLKSNQVLLCRPELPSDVKHELSSPAQTLCLWLESHSRHGYLCVFFWGCVVLCAGKPSYDELIHRPRSPTVYKFKKLRKQPKPNTGL
jgi:hypothetical protein